MNTQYIKSGVYIIGKTDCGEEVCAASGRISTQHGTALEIFSRSDDKDKNTSLISKVTKSGHTSTVEHMFFNLAFENVSVTVEQFMIEFRLASFTVKSRRYVDFGNSGYYTPDFESSEITEKYRKHMDYLFAEYSSFIEAGIAKEDARFLLPYCFFSNFYCSLNGRELLLVLRRMLWGRESKNAEINALGKQLYAQASKEAPGIFADFLDKAPTRPDEPQLDFVLTEKPENMDKLPDSVQLLAATPDAQMVIAKTCLIGSGKYSGHEDDILADRANVSKTISAVMSSTRQRSLEAVNFTFKLCNVSLSCITHFARHRMQSIKIPALSTARRDSFIIPPSVAENKQLLERYNNAFLKNTEFYNELKAAGYSEETLVYCLLSGNTLDIVTTMNARELLLFFKLRTCNRAQWEIRDFAAEMLIQLKAIEPALFKFFGPSCCTDGICPEGRLTCGRAAEMRKNYKIE